MTGASTTPVNIEIRRNVRFDFSASPAVHHRNNPYLSHFWNALSVMAPSTERILMRVARAVRGEISDPRLLEDLNALVAQEALHTREHRRWNARLSELGYDIEGVNAELDQIFDDYVARVDRPAAVALMIAGEHLIYAMSHALLADPRVTEEKDPEVKRLFLWHAAEEMEHQSVAHDVYVHLFGEGLSHRLIRARAFADSGRLLLGSVRDVMRRLLATEPDRSAAHRLELARFMALSPGYARQLCWKASCYFHPGFAPWKDPGDLDLIRRALGAYGAEASRIPLN